MSSANCCFQSTTEDTLETPKPSDTEAVENEQMDSVESSSSSSLSSSDDLEGIFLETEGFSQLHFLEDNDDLNDGPPKTKNELLPEELPFIEETFPLITPEFEIRPAGWLSTVVESFLVIESFEAEPVLDVGSLIVFEDRNPVGRVFDVLGPVRQPCYSIRVRPTDEKFKECVGKSVFYVVEYSRFVDTNNAYMKGSDASWYNDEEVPVEFQDCSDDENERKLLKGRSAQLLEKGKSKKHPKTSRTVEADIITTQGSIGKQVIAESECVETASFIQDTQYLQSRTLPCLESLQLSKGSSSIPGLTRRSS